MHLVWKVIPILLFVLLTNIGAQTKTVTLQNGLDEYNGCLDSYVDNQTTEPIKGDVDSLLLWFMDS